MIFFANNEITLSDYLYAQAVKIDKYWKHQVLTDLTDILNHSFLNWENYFKKKIYKNELNKIEITVQPFKLAFLKSLITNQEF